MLLAAFIGGVILFFVGRHLEKGEMKERLRRIDEKYKKR